MHVSGILNQDDSKAQIDQLVLCVVVFFKSFTPHSGSLDRYLYVKSVTKELIA